MEETAIAGGHGSRKRRVALLLGLLGVLLIIFRGTVSDLVGIWNSSSTFNHCFLIPLLSAYLIWEKRLQMRTVPMETSRLALLWSGMNSLLWLAGAFLDIAFFQHLALVGLIIGATWAVLGNPLFRLLLFPLFYLYFAVPEGEFLVPKLQDLTAWFSVNLLRLSGIPVYIEGLYITVPSGNFIVAEACSGINYLIATLALGTLYAYLSYRSWKRRALFMVLAVLVPLIANGIRAYGIIMIAHLSGHKYAVGVDHIIYGWVFFGIVIFALFAIGNLFSEDTADESRLPSEAGESAAVMGRGLMFAALTFMIAGAAPALYSASDARLNAPRELRMPAASGISVSETDDLLGVRYKGAGSLEFFAIKFGETSFGMVRAYYPQQGEGAELVQSVNRTFGRKAWRRQSSHLRDTGAGFQAKEMLLRGQGDYLVWVWWDLHGQRTTNALQAKLAQARARLFGSDSGVAAYQVFIAVDDVESLERARAALSEFVRKVQPGLTSENP